MRRTRGGASGRRYARALLDVALEKKQAEPLAAELQGLAELVAGHAELSALLTNPAVSAERKKKLVAAVAKSAKVTDLAARLLGILGERDRLGDLPGIAAAYAKLWNAHRGVVAAEAVSAQPLDAAQSKAVEQALASLTGRAVELRSKVDPALVGGMLVNIEGRTYDGSVRARLLALRRRLSGVDGAGRQAS
jgi:F-type H+-transporting ATPase subunit delta